MDALNIQAARILKLFGDTQTAAVRAERRRGAGVFPQLTAAFTSAAPT